MHIQPARKQAWLTELMRIQAEIAANGMPAPAARRSYKRIRNRKPLWEE